MIIRNKSWYFQEFHWNFSRSHVCSSVLRNILLCFLTFSELIIYSSVDFIKKSIASGIAHRRKLPAVCTIMRHPRFGLATPHQPRDQSTLVAPRIRAHSLALSSHPILHTCLERLSPGRARALARGFRFRALEVKGRKVRARAQLRGFISAQPAHLSLFLLPYLIPLSPSCTHSFSHTVARARLAES